MSWCDHLPSVVRHLSSVSRPHLRITSLLKSESKFSSNYMWSLLHKWSWSINKDSRHYSSPELRKLKQQSICPCLWIMYMYNIEKFLNAFFSYAALLVLIEFHMEPSVIGRVKICTNGSASLNKLAAMPINGKAFPFP